MVRSERKWKGQRKTEIDERSEPRGGALGAMNSQSIEFTK